MKSIKNRLILYMVIVACLTLLVQGSYTIYSLNTINKNDLETYKQTLYNRFDREIKLEVETAVSAIDQIHKRQLNGEFTEEQAKATAAEIVRQLRFDNNASYFWVDTAEGVNVVLPNNKAEGTNRLNAQDSNGIYYVQEFIKNGKLSGGGYSDYAFPRPGETLAIAKRGYTLYYQPYNWVIGTGNYVDDIEKVVAQAQQEKNSEFYSRIMMSLLAVVFSLAVSVGLGVFFGKKIANPIVRITDSVKRVAEGDLRVEKIDIQNQDELGELAEGFNIMSENLRQLVRQITGSSSQLASASQQLSAGAEQLAKAASSVAEVIAEVSVGTEKQLSAVTEVSVVVDEMNAAFGNIISEVKTVTDVSDQTSATAERESLEIDNTMTQMVSIESTTNNAAQLVNHLGERSREIGQIVDTISGIAEQTNLLALNAAIEAARAGDQGRGFAVVADEVRKLAEQSQDAAKQIADLIKQIQLDTDKAVTAMNSGTEEVKVGTKSVNNAGKTFKQIAGLIGNVSERINGSAVLLNQTAMNSEKIVGAVLEVDRISREIAAQTQSVNAAVEEQTASSEEIASSSTMLMKNAEEMQSFLSRFQL